MLAFDSNNNWPIYLHEVSTVLILEILGKNCSGYNVIWFCERISLLSWCYDVIIISGNSLIAYTLEVHHK